jgi:hypothetical protein
MNKYLLFFFFSVLCTDAIAQNNFIVAGQKGTAAYVDLVPDHFVNCSPTPPSETCGPVYDSLDLNKDSEVDYELMSYHTGYSGLSYEFHRIFPMGNNEVLADTFTYTAPFVSNYTDGRAMPVDTGKTISGAGLFLADSVMINYTDSLGFPADSMHHFNRHFIFRNTVGTSYTSFFLDIPTVMFYQSMWQGSGSNYEYLGLRFFKGADTIYAWLRTNQIAPAYYYDYAITGQIMSVDELQNATTLTLSPNPAQETVTINRGNILPSQLRLIDALGRTLPITLITEENRTQINIATLPQGLYMVLVNDGNTVLTAKLMKE